eukprot:Em0004g660a
MHPHAPLHSPDQNLSQGEKGLKNTHGGARIVTPYIQDNSMTEQVCNPRALKRNAGRRLKGSDRWIHEDYHHQDPNILGHHTFVAAAADNLAPRRPSELRLCGLGTRRATDASSLMVKERRMSCSNSPTLERASPRTLRSLGALKDLVRTCRAMDSPRLDSPTVANLFSDVATMDPGAHRSIVRSLSGEGHDTKHLQRRGSIKAFKLDRCRKYHKAHNFEIYSYKSPHWCGQCHNFIWGLSQQGMRCKVCKMDIHKHCHLAALEVECSPSKKVVGQVFGVDLTILAMLDDDDVPKVVQECVNAIESNGLSAKGLYRVSGQIASVMDIREKYNKGEEVDFSVYTDVNIVTGVLKQFLRELPQPVITYDAYSQIMKATAAVSTMEEDYTPLSSALKLLPKAHYLLLRYLGEHLHRVVDHSTDDLVTAHNLAVIMAPTLMRAPSDCTTIFKDVHLQQYFLECVIAKSDRLFS